MTLRIGALFAGYGGLDMAVMDTLDAELAWYAELDKAPAKVMAHHHPDVPNLWDVTKVDWAAVEPVDIITGGSPCQDLSHAGKRKGMTDGTRSNLWVAMRESIAVLRPRLVVWENVRGAYSAAADSEMGWCDRCVARHRKGGKSLPALRALGRVLGDLSDLGYDARWYGLRASDVGGAHGRFRVFVIAAPSESANVGLERSGASRHGWSGSADGGSGVVDLLPTPRATRGGSHTETVSLLPTPRATDGTKGGPNQRGSSGDLMLPSAVVLLPTPAVNDMGAAYTPETWDAWTERMKAKHGNGNGHGASLAIEAQRLTPDQGSERVTSALGPLLPTPTSADHKASGSRGYGGNEFSTLTDATVRYPQDWGQYEAAIRRAEIATGRPAPSPTHVSQAWVRARAKRFAPGQKMPAGMRGSLRRFLKPEHQLAAEFVEWLMMLPAGHVTDPAIGLTRNEQLKALGNGVVPAQAAAALRAYIQDEKEQAA